MAERTIVKLKSKDVDNTRFRAKADNRHPEKSVASNIADSLIIQRKASCACGGGCSTCQANHSNLPVSHPNDASEIEADRIADKVMPMEMPEQSNLSSTKNSVQKKESQSDSISFVPPVVRDVLSSGGKPLEKDTRAFMESRFDYDFGNVKIHDDNLAAKSANSINALAFTSGNDIVFNARQYAPNSERGKRLLAHELAHVVQQSDRNILKRQPAKDQKKDEKQEYIDKIKSTYKVKDVVDGDASFKSAELKLVFEALGKIPTPDLPAIQNVIVKRVKNEGPNVVAIYFQEQTYSGTQLIDEHYITITDLAFSVPRNETIHSIAHEVGHAVSVTADRLATSAANKAEFERNKTDLARYQKHVEAKNLAKDAQSTEDTRRAKWAEVTALEKDLAVKTQDRDAKNAALLASFGDITDFLEKAKVEKALAEKEFNSVSTALSADNTISKPYSDSLRDFQTGLLNFYDAQIVKNVKRSMNVNVLNTETQKLEAIRQKRDAAFNALKKADGKNAALVNFDKLVQAQNKFLETSFFAAGNINMSKPVRRFYDFVVANNIVPTTAFSPYAKSKWREKPGEFYAECYSFFVTDSKKLEAFSKPLFEWFKAGNYK